MKFFIAFAALVAFAAASPVVKPVTSEMAELEAIIAAIQSPSTDPATAALLEQQLLEIISAVNPIDIQPVWVTEPEAIPEPVIIGPTIVPPKPDGGAVTNPIAPSPVVIGELAPGAPIPLVQIIVNVADNSPVTPVIKPEPVHIVDAPVEPVNVVEVAPEPIEVEVAPVQVVEPVPVEPVIIGTPILPEAAVILPEELN